MPSKIRNIENISKVNDKYSINHRFNDNDICSRFILSFVFCLNTISMKDERHWHIHCVVPFHFELNITDVNVKWIKEKKKKLKVKEWDRYRRNNIYWLFSISEKKANTRKEQKTKKKNFNNWTNFDSNKNKNVNKEYLSRFKINFRSTLHLFFVDFFFVLLLLFCCGFFVLSFFAKFNCQTISRKKNMRHMLVQLKCFLVKNIFHLFFFCCLCVCVFVIQR